jgi:hypothetical protein
VSTSTATTTDRRLLFVFWILLAGLIVWAVTLVPDTIPPLALVPGLPGLLYAVIGAFLVLRTGARLIGWLLTLQMLLILNITGTFVFAAGGATWAGVVGPLAWNFLALLTAAIILFPTGRPASGVLSVLLVGMVALSLFASTHWLGVNLGWWEGLTDPQDLAIALNVVPLLLAFLEQARIFQRRPALERQQVKPFLLAFATQTLYVVPLALGWSEDAFNIVNTVLTMTIPIAIFIGITRYRLYDIDRVISRTVGYAIIVTALGVLGVGGVTFVTSLLPTQDRLAVALSTVGVMALFDPLRRRVIDVVDRRFDRTRYEARQVVEDFGRSVQDVTDVEEIADRVRAVLGRTIAPTTVAVWQPPATGTAHR